MPFCNLVLNSESKHIQEFARSRVGIDAYAWLHKGTFSCAMEICRGNQTRAYVDYCVNRIRMLLYFNVTPVLVFDGADLPMKADTHAERRGVREKALAEAEAAYAKGDRTKAAQLYQRACPVTSEMARHVIRRCRQMNVEYVVAPFEADAQLAWMMHVGHIDSIITEDSDLLVYGASKIFFKMDKQGHGDLFQSKNLPSLRKISLANFTEDMIVCMCVCAGCDFFKGVHGLGILKAHAIVRKHRTMSRIISAILRDNRYRVSKTFTADFARACLVFRHQTVFNVRTGETVSLRPLSESMLSSLPNGVILKNGDGVSDLSFLGRQLDSSVAKLVAEGCVHPRSLKEYDEPLDIVERPLVVSKPNSILHQPVRTVVQSKPPSGFQVAGTSGSTTKTPRQSVLSVPPPTSSYSEAKTLQQRTPNLKQRLGAPKSRFGGAAVFDPIREAQKFRATNKPYVSRKSPARTPGIWKKFQSEGHSQRTSPVAGSTNLESDPNLGSDEVPIDSIADKLDFESKGVTRKLTMTGKAEQAQDAPALKRPRHLSHLSKTMEVNRMTDKSATVPSTVALELRREVVQPPSPDHDSFQLFNEIDEFSRDGSNEIEARANKAPFTETPSRYNSSPATSTTSSRKSLPVMSLIRKSGLPRDGKQCLRRSRFFTSSQGETAAPSSYDGNRKNDLKRKDLQISGGSQAALALTRENAERSPVQFDNSRRGAAGKKVMAYPAARTGDQ